MLDTKRAYVCFIVVFSGFGGILYGYDLGAITGAFLFIRHDIAMTMQEMSFVGGAVLFGGAFATLITGPLSDWFGRRRMVMVAAVIFIIGIFVLVYANNYTEVLLGRLVQGVGVGIITIAIPLYIVESVPANIRGRAMGVFQLLLNGGILLGTLVGLYYTPTENWRAMFMPALIPAFILLIGAFFLTSSPRWLVARGQEDKALAALKRSRSKSSAEMELAFIKKRHKQDKQSHLNTIWQHRYILPLGIVFAAAILAQLTGINSIIQYSAIILKDSGLHSNIGNMLGSNFINGLNFVVVMVMLFFLDKVGRKLLLSIGTAGIVLSLLIGGAVYHWLPTGDLKGYLVLASLLGFIFFFALGPGILIWLVLSELLPSRIRSTGMAIALFLNSLTSAGLASVYLNLQRVITYAGIFWICAGCTVLYFLLAAFVIPEARGKTLEEVETCFNK